jgi:MerC mercury resistance protein
MEGTSDVAAVGRWDRVGMLVSGACAVHCTLLPLLMAAVPVLGLGRLLDERVEWFFIITTGLVGVSAHLRAYSRDHHHVVPGLIFLAGFSFVLVARLFLESHWLGPFAVGIGGLLAAASHWANLRLCRCCRECASE